jgi:hypothetical protein
MTEVKARPRPRPPPVETTPIFGGRLWIAVGILVGLGVVANPVFNQYLASFAPREPMTDRRQWRVGGASELTVTLVTADSNRLACSHDQTFDGAHCAFDGKGRPWPETSSGQMDDNNKNVIQPYRTSPDNLLVLITGLWAQPAVQLRLHREPPSEFTVKRLQRFEARCKVKFIGKLDEVKLRWDTGGRWQPEKQTLIAKPESCTVKGEI